MITHLLFLVTLLRGLWRLSLIKCKPTPLLKQIINMALNKSSNLPSSMPPPSRSSLSQPFRPVLPPTSIVVIELTTKYPAINLPGITHPPSETGPSPRRKILDQRVLFQSSLVDHLLSHSTNWSIIRSSTWRRRRRRWSTWVMTCVKLWLL